MATQVGQVRVVSGVCPILGREVIALWNGDAPVVPATAFLRAASEDNELSTESIRNRAYGLLSLWRFLETSDPAGAIAFWDVNEFVVRAFKRELVNRIALPAHLPHPTNPQRRVRNPDHLERATANKYLDVVRELMAYWRRADDLDMRRAGRQRKATPGITRTRPAGSIFRIVRRGGGSRRVRLGLTEDQCQLVWAFLERQYPSKPTILRTRPTTATAWNRWRAAERRWEKQKMLYYRDRAVWAYLLMTGMRIGELVRQRVDDYRQADGRANIVDRVEDRYLGDLKTGEDVVSFGRSHPLAKVLENWELYGIPLADKILRQRTKHAECPMLFRNDDGGALTQNAVRHLTSKIFEGCELWNSVRRFSPHIARHTVASLMLDAGVELSAVQAFLRHQSVATTERYAVLSEPKVRESINRFHSSVAHLLPAPVPSAGQ